jgi:hypothetical protein
MPSRPSTTTGRAGDALETCAHCGAAAPVPVTGVVRSTIVVHCSPGCRDDHLAALALAASTCRAPGCDLDAAADVPYCDEHLDPAVTPMRPGGRRRAA